MRKFKLLMLLIALAIGSITQAQTVLISPTGDGGFETGAGLVANGWTVVNHATNQWFAGTVAFSAGANGAYVSNDAGVTNSYTIAGTQTSHFYRDITVPAGESKIALTFKYKGTGEAGYDRLLVYTAPTTVTPVAGTPASTVTTLTGATLIFTQTATQATYITQTIVLPASLAGSTFRLIFTWQNDGSVGANPPAAVDEINLTSMTPIPMHGIYTIDNTLPTSTPLLHNGTDNFASFTAAVTNLNSEGISGPVTFNVLTGLTFTEIVPAITTAGTSTNTITFQKFGSSANPKILAGVGVGAADAAVTINGADYITFDGIDIQENAANTTTNTKLEYGYYVKNITAIDGAQNNTIKNCKIILDRTNTATRAIYSLSSTPSNATGANSNNSYYSNTIENTYSGIFLTGNATYPDLNTMITNNMVGASTANDIGNGSSASNGIRVTSQNGVTIANNVVRNVTTTGANAIGIFLESAQGTTNIFNNKVYTIGTSSTTATNIVYGIRTDINATFTANVFNNMVADLYHGIATPSATISIRALAVGVSGSGTGNYAYNSVSITEDANVSSAAFYLNAGTANLVNNVFANLSTAGITSKRHCIYRFAGTLTSNFNDLYVDPAGTNNFIGFYTADQATLALWQTASGNQDLASVSVNPTFTSTTDLHTTNTTLNGTGTPVAGITLDIDGDLRDVTTPDLGADENLAPPAFTCAAPAPGNTISSANPICFGQIVNLSMQNATAGTGVSYQWQSSTDGTTYSNISGATNPIYSTPPQVPTFYQCIVTCVNGPVTGTSTPVQVTFTNSVTSTTPGSRCGAGSVALAAVGSAGTTLNWYPGVTGGPALGTGTTFTTPVISNTTTYFVSAEVSSPVNAVIGTGTTLTGATTQPTAFCNRWAQYWQQTVFTAAELQAAGLGAGNITSISYSITTLGDGTNVANYECRIGTTTATTLSAFTSTGLNLVYGPSTYTHAVGVNTITFTTPYYWDGTSNIIIDVRHDGADMTNNAITYYTATAGNTVVFATTSTPASTSELSTMSPTANVSTQRLNVTLAGTANCTSPRIPVVASVSTATPIALTAPQTVCNNGVATMSVTSTLSEYDSYVWTPETNLFTDLACTTPYVAGGNFSTVYMKTATAGAYTYTCTANNSVSFCSDFETTSVNVLPSVITLSASPSVICVSGPSTVTPSPATGFGDATFQWQFSTDGVNFTNIPGATSLILNIPALTQTSWGKLIVSINGVPCVESDAGLLTVNNPTVATTTPATRCGIGTLNLAATASASAGLFWYTSLTGGYPVAAGNTFTTPSLSATTPYYVEPYQENAPFNVGKLNDPSGSLTSFAGYGMFFATIPSAIINSVDIYPSTAGTLNVFLVNELSDAVDMRTFTIDAADISNTVKKTLTLDFLVPAGSTGWMLYYDIAIYRGGGTYAYPYASNGFSITGNSVNGDNVTGGTRMYLYNWSVTTLCSGSRTQVDATVTTPPAFSVLASSNDICAGETVSLEASSANAGYTYAWESGTWTATGSTINYTPNSTSTVTATATDNSGGANNGCVATQTSSITVRPVPVGTVANASDISITCGESIDLSSIPSSGTTVLINEGFNGATNNWITIDNSTGGTAPTAAAWTLRADGYSYSSVVYHSNDNSQFYFSNSDEQGSGGTTATILESPSFSTLGLSTIQMSFYTYYRLLGDAAVDVWNGSVWTEVASYTTTVGTASAFEQRTIDLTAYAGLADVKVRFNYNCNYGWYWAIDNVLIEGTNPTFNYAWTSVPAGFTASTQNAVGATPNENTVYTVVLTNPQNCTASASVSVAVDALPAPTVTVADNCGNSVLTASNYTGTLTWNTTESTPSITVTAAGAYNVFYTDGSCVSQNGTATAAPIAVPAIPGVTNQTACTGATIPDLTVTGAGTMNWYDDVALTNLVNTGLSFATGETTAATYTYYVNATESGCTGPVATITLTINEAPSATLTPTNPSACGLSDGTIAATTGFTYNWSTNPVQTNATATGLNAGAYYVTVSNANCNVVLSSTLSDPGAPTVTLSANDSSICPSTMVTFTAGGADSYEFFINGNSVQGPSATNTYESANLYDGYAVTVNGTTTGCTGISTAVDMIVFTPAAVTITEISGSLVSDVSFGNQWYEQTTGLLTDSINASITPVVDGNFYVVVTDANGCTATSNVINFIYVSTSNVDFNAGISVYPNPSNGMVFVKSNSPVSYAVTTIDGKVILRNEVKSTEATMDLSSHAKGIYFVRFSNDTETAVYRIVIE